MYRSSKHVLFSGPLTSEHPRGMTYNLENGHDFSAGKLGSAQMSFHTKKQQRVSFESPMNSTMQQ